MSGNFVPTNAQPVVPVVNTPEAHVIANAAVDPSIASQGWFETYQSDGAAVINYWAIRNVAGQLEYWHGDGATGAAAKAAATRWGYFDPALGKIVAPIISVNQLQADTIPFTSSDDLPYLGPSIVPVDCTTGFITINLPAASSCKGSIFVFTKTDFTANAFQCFPNGGDTVNSIGAASVVYGHGSSLILVSDGISNWLQLGPVWSNDITMDGFPTKTGFTSIDDGDNSVAVTFGTPYPDADYQVVAWYANNLQNTVLTVLQTNKVNDHFIITAAANMVGATNIGWTARWYYD